MWRGSHKTLAEEASVWMIDRTWVLYRSWETIQQPSIILTAIEKLVCDHLCSDLRGYRSQMDSSLMREARQGHGENPGDEAREHVLRSVPTRH